MFTATLTCLCTCFRKAMLSAIRFYFVFVSPWGLDWKMAPEIVPVLCWHCIYVAIFLSLCIDTAVDFFIDEVHLTFWCKQIVDIIWIQTKILLTPANECKTPTLSCFERIVSPVVTYFVERSNALSTIEVSPICASFFCCYAAFPRSSQLKVCSFKQLSLTTSIKFAEFILFWKKLRNCFGLGSPVFFLV